MSKIWPTILLLLISLAYPIDITIAKTAGSSAKLIAPNSKKSDNRAQVLRGFFEQQNSPLKNHANTFIKEADKNNLDWKLVAAISGNESQFGHLIPQYSFNGWGYGVYGTNVRYFKSWDEGIEVVSNALRKDYLDNWGATNIYEIGAIYAEDPLWANKVNHYLAQIEKFESTNTNTSISFSL